MIGAASAHLPAGVAAIRGCSPAAPQRQTVRAHTQDSGSRCRGRNNAILRLGKRGAAKIFSISPGRP